MLSRLSRSLCRPRPSLPYRTALHARTSLRSPMSSKYLFRFARPRSATAVPSHCRASHPWRRVVSSFHPSVCGSGGGCYLASSQSVVGASRRSAAPGSQLVGAAEYGSSFLSLRSHGRSGGKVVGGFFMFAGSGPCQRLMPNPSIERTNNGGSQLRAIASAQPPLFASHLKR